MPLTSGERDAVVAQWRQVVHDGLKHKADWNVADIRAAVDSVDDTLDLNASVLTQNQTVLQNLNARLAEPFKSSATTPQKWLLLAYVALKRSGLL